MTEVAVQRTYIVQRSQREKGRDVKRTNRNEKIGARLTYGQTISEGRVLPKRSQHIHKPHDKPTKHAHAHAKVKERHEPSRCVFESSSATAYTCTTYVLDRTPDLNQEVNPECERRH